MFRAHYVRPWERGLAAGMGLLISMNPCPPLAAIPLASASSACALEFEPFIRAMLKEIPAYINRVNTRSNNRQSYVLLASRADFDALPLRQSSFPTANQDSTEVRQVFFSTVTKRIANQAVVYGQEHHWLLMAPSDRGWEFVQMYSVLESYPAQTLTTAPRNSSEGATATAIKTWLKRCRTQAVS